MVRNLATGKLTVDKVFTESQEFAPLEPADATEAGYTMVRMDNDERYIASIDIAVEGDDSASNATSSQKAEPSSGSSGKKKKKAKRKVSITLPKK